MAKLMEQYRNRDFVGELEDFLSKQVYEWAVNSREDLTQKKEEYGRLLEEKKQIKRDLKDAWPKVAVYNGPTTIIGFPIRTEELELNQNRTVKVGTVPYKCEKYKR
ncbi:hypothetical protein BDA99DRAFT_543306 [Phascolomyces articulosus]|uniref:Uncharacterized protein n=1 Tax=Phascolomyces articulosus TaxID=60185 RepID=A0AAD5P806_9FUNG|nr:hypothetical protein BDA99DRAFT_543306 [Phascolomyces articulosus]